MRHIAVLTGKRGGYGAMKPMLRAMEEDPEIRLSLIVTDQHVNPKFGSTITEIEKDFNVAAAIDMEQLDDNARSRSKAIGVCLTKISDVLSDFAPDILVLYGDRGEVLAAAVAAVTLRIVIAHLQGGDVSGNVDELMRHAITKLSHLHFPSTQNSRDRILAMGEEAWRVQVVGDNHIDQIVSGEYTDSDTVRKRFDIEADEEPIILLLHPETTRLRDGYRDMCNVLEAVLEQQRRVIIVYPCSDHGYEDIISAIHDYENQPGFAVYKNIEAPDFWGLLSIAGVMIGNSSAGLIETPYFRIPAINVGERQRGREHGNNVIHCNYDLNTLRASIAKAFFDPVFKKEVANCLQPFGDGFAWWRIVDRLKNVELGYTILDKRLTY